MHLPDVVGRRVGLLKKAAAEHWAQARADLATATLLLDAGAFYACAFFAQQAAEKCLKAVCIGGFGRTHRGHDLIAITNYLQAPLDIMNCAADLNDSYDGALYPDGDGVPFQRYGRADADRHLRAAQRIIAWARELDTQIPAD